MFEKLEDVERRYETLYHLLGQPEVISKQEELQKVAREYAELGKVVDLYRKFKKLDVEIEESQTPLGQRRGRRDEANGQRRIGSIGGGERKGGRGSEVGPYSKGSQ